MWTENNSTQEKRIQALSKKSHKWHVIQKLYEQLQEKFTALADIEWDLLGKCMNNMIMKAFTDSVNKEKFLLKYHL